MEINGRNYGTSSIGRALSRHKAEQQDKAKGDSDKAGHSADGAMEKLKAVHEGAEGADKSFHVYQKSDGKVEAHAHDHKAGTSEHKSHPDMKSAKAHMDEHMGSEGSDSDESEYDGEEGMSGALSQE